jgi:hypothetical protein
MYNHDIVVRKHTVLGSLQLIKSITPVEVKLAETSSKEKERTTATQSQVNAMAKETRERDNTNDDQFLPEVDLIGLTERQRQVVLTC